MFKVFLLDDDSIFRIALFTALQEEKYRDLEIIAQAEIAALSDILADEIPDLLILGIDLIRYPERLNSLVFLCEQLHNKYPNLIIFLLTPLGANETIKKIPGVKGCCPKKTDIEELVNGLKICAKGDNYFPKITNLQKTNKKLGGWLYNQCKFGLKQVEINLESISTYLNNQNLSALDTLFWQGRRRELIVARWCIYQLLPSSYEDEINEENQEILNNDNNNLETIKAPLLLPYSNSNLPNSFEITIKKIQASVTNCTGIILEIDILKNQKKQELLFLIINQIQRVLQELIVINLDPQQLKERTPIILKDLWQNSTINFLSHYYSSEDVLNNNQYNLITLILEDVPLIEKESLNNIPFVTELLAYWLFQEHLKIDNETYDYNSENAQNIEEILLQNLLINLANSVMQFVLNNFYDLPTIRYNFYDEEWKSSRKIAMFRNNLSWRYRKQKYWENPQNIFEDQYTLLKLDYQGIIRCKITHPRNQELAQLQGLPYVVTMLTEFKDGISKVVKALYDIIGKTLVYLLTEVIGKGIGLIGKGILQAIGKKVRN